MPEKRQFKNAIVPRRVAVPWGLGKKTLAARNKLATVTTYSGPVDPNQAVQMLHIDDDPTGDWFGISFISSEELVSDPAGGWIDQAGLNRIDVLQSTDLVTWNSGTFDPNPDPGVEISPGVWKYEIYCEMPRIWREVNADFRFTCSRYDKEITNIFFREADVVLDYPYAMPADSARLVADLKAQFGTNQVTCTVTSNPISVMIKDHRPKGAYVLTPTMSGANVTDITYHSSSIPLPSYPYAMPAAKDTLQADLRAAGYNGAVVTLFGDEWEIMILRQQFNDKNRQMKVTIAPSDPYPFWDVYENYQGENSNDLLSGHPENITDIYGQPLAEYQKQFYRLKLSPII